MDQTALLFVLIVAAAAGIVATLAILRHQRQAAEAARESPFATSTEGMKRCPHCGGGNLVTDRTCNSCGKRLPG